MADNWQEMEQAGRRALRYWYVDGLSEVGVGLIMLLVGLLFWMEELAPDAPLAQATEFTMPIVVIAGGLSIRRLVEAAKQRLTYRRTGYVSYRRPQRWRQPLGILVAVVLGASVTALVALYPGSVRWLPVAQGMVVAAALALTAHRFGVGRLYLHAALSVLLGVALGNLPWSGELAAAAYYSALGLALALGGLAVLGLYLRRNGAMDEG